MGRQFVLVDRQAGSGSINTTHLVAFQEKSDDQTTPTSTTTTVIRRRNRSLFYEDINIGNTPVIKKQNPAGKFVDNNNSLQVDESSFNRLHLIWLYLRKYNSFNQNVPMFKGWKLLVRSGKLKTPYYKTVETYLPPINAKVTDYVTIQRYMQYLQSLAKSVKMPYVNITLDVGAAMNAFLIKWNQPEVYRNIIIHLRYFHFLKENFQVKIV